MRSQRKRWELGTTDGRKTAPLGDLVVAAFDEAAIFSTDPLEVSRLATLTVIDLLRWAPRMAAAGPPPRALR
ncbi:MAG: hypothetical protein JXB32_18455 [Deltaproteobacteria bacterium]|nr:hypothetical protein [Deltaproteobacteria bacterium]